MESDYKDIPSFDELTGTNAVLAADSFTDRGGPGMLVSHINDQITQLFSV